MKANTIYGYIRVSTANQREDRQRLAMENFGIARSLIFADKESGKDFDRPAYRRLMKRLAAGDTIVINIKTRYLIQSHFWVQSSEALDIWAFGDFSL